MVVVVVSIIDGMEGRGGERTDGINFLVAAS